MSIVLAAIDKEREHVKTVISQAQTRLDVLDQLEREALRLGLTRKAIGNNGDGHAQPPSPSPAMLPVRKPPPGVLRNEILELMKSGRLIGKRDMRIALNVGHSDVNAAIDELLDQRRIQRVGERAGTRYVLTEVLDARAAANPQTGAVS